MKRILVRIFLWATLLFLGITAEQAAHSQESMVDKYVTESLQKGFETLKPTLPIKIDAFTTLVDASAVGKTATYDYVLNMKLSKEQWHDFEPVLRKKVLDQNCKNQNMIAIMSLGAIYRYRYKTTDSQELGIFQIERKDCNNH